MPIQKWCDVSGCKNFVFATLEDFYKYKWIAYKLPNKKVKCFCPEHKDNAIKGIEQDIMKFQKGG